jgi:E3 ubiquitin-protein ligase HERC1
VSVLFYAHTFIVFTLPMYFIKVWPALAVIGGVDRGLRVGGQCIHKPSGRKAVVLGTLKQGLASVRVQWDDAEASVR